jgi:tetratricopeptide (TPR) repeat protein
VLIDPEKILSYPLKREAVEAYRTALDMNPSHIPALSQLLMHLADLKDERFWEDFRRFVELDKQGEQLRNVVDTFYNFEAIDEGIAILQDAVRSRPDQVELRLSLASAYLLDDRSEEAGSELDKAKSLTHNPQLLIDIDRLFLAADDPEFDARLGDITERVDAGSELDSDDVEYLETAIEKAPLFAAGYSLLANAYLAWGETSDALDVLLDGQKQLPDDPEIAVLLARVLWNEGESQLALDCLNKALAKNPQHVPLLALTGQFLFEDGQEDGARVFLARAETINPRHPMLMEVRVYIANSLSS